MFDRLFQSKSGDNAAVGSENVTNKITLKNPPSTSSFLLSSSYQQASPAFQIPQNVSLLRLPDATYEQEPTDKTLAKHLEEAVAAVIALSETVSPSKVPPQQVVHLPNNSTQKENKTKKKKQDSSQQTSQPLSKAAAVELAAEAERKTRAALAQLSVHTSRAEKQYILMLEKERAALLEVKRLELVAKNQEVEAERRRKKRRLTNSRFLCFTAKNKVVPFGEEENESSIQPPQPPLVPSSSPPPTPSITPLLITIAEIGAIVYTLQAMMKYVRSPLLIRMCLSIFTSLLPPTCRSNRLKFLAQGGLRKLTRVSQFHPWSPDIVKSICALRLQIMKPEFSSNNTLSQAVLPLLYSGSLVPPSILGPWIWLHTPAYYIEYSSSSSGNAKMKSSIGDGYHDRSITHTLSEPALVQGGMQTLSRVEKKKHVSSSSSSSSLPISSTSSSNKRPSSFLIGNLHACKTQEAIERTGFYQGSIASDGHNAAPVMINGQHYMPPTVLRLKSEDAVLAQNVADTMSASTWSYTKATNAWRKATLTVLPENLLDQLREIADASGLGIDNHTAAAGGGAGGGGGGGGGGGEKQQAPGAGIQFVVKGKASKLQPHKSSAASDTLTMLAETSDAIRSQKRLFGTAVTNETSENNNKKHSDTNSTIEGATTADNNTALPKTNSSLATYSSNANVVHPVITRRAPSFSNLSTRHLDILNEATPSISSVLKTTTTTMSSSSSSSASASTTNSTTTWTIPSAPHTSTSTVQSTPSVPVALGGMGISQRRILEESARTMTRRKSLASVNSTTTPNTTPTPPATLDRTLSRRSSLRENKQTIQPTPVKRRDSATMIAYKKYNRALMKS